MGCQDMFLKLLNDTTTTNSFTELARLCTSSIS
jgi:hypothetical protein